jgi:hypothetical protein
VPRTSLVFGFTRCLCARKARHLDVGEVIVFAIISGPSELVIKARSLRRQSVAAIVCLVDALMLLLFVSLCRHFALKAVLLELLYDNPC